MHINFDHLQVASGPLRPLEDNLVPSADSSSFKCSMMVRCEQVQTANGILSNPELRAKYEAGGLAALDDAALQQHGLQVLLMTD